MYCKKCGCKILTEEKCPECGADVTDIEYCGGFWGLVEKTASEDEEDKVRTEEIIKEGNKKPSVGQNQEAALPVKKEKSKTT